jgi:ketosteroid isomerase-like protein
MSDTPRRVAEAFSGHRFAEAYPALADDVRWELVGERTLVGRQAVIDACEATLAGLGEGSTESLRVVVVAESDRVAVDTITRYTTPDGATGVVSSCDVYEFAGDRLTAIRSYAVELDAGTMPRA